MEDKGNIAVIGAGVTGLTAAERLAARYGSRVVLIERESSAGGLAATLTRNGLRFDLGSHRLHPKSRRRALKYIEQKLEGELLEMERRGKLYFRGRYINYPPDIINFLKMFPLSDVASFARGFLRPRGKTPRTDFESVMTRKYGRELYDAFYREYAWKIWGKDPAGIEIEGIKRLKVSPDFSTMSRALSLAPHRFFYPRRGIGAIGEAIEKSAASAGARILKNTRVSALKRSGGRVTGVTTVNSRGTAEHLEVSAVVSTIPIDELYPLLNADSGGSMLEWRGARFLYLVFDRPAEGASETYYFPNKDVIFGRISEINKYSPELNQGLKGCLLTVEVPATPGDEIWRMEEKELLDKVLKDMVRAGVITRGHGLVEHFAISIPKIYPIYQHGWKPEFNRLYDAAGAYDNLYSIGRGGLFLHINIDHCVTQGLELADHISSGAGGRQKWESTAERYSGFSARD
jgi:protoporphyrinogen oxidase